MCLAEASVTRLPAPHPLCRDGHGNPPLVVAVHEGNAPAVLGRLGLVLSSAIRESTSAAAAAAATAAAVAA